MKSLSKLKTRAEKLIGHSLKWQDTPHGDMSLAYDGEDIISIDTFKEPHIARVNGSTIPLVETAQPKFDIVQMIMDL